jgi:hypothetical protein
VGVSAKCAALPGDRVLFFVSRRPMTKQPPTKFERVRYTVTFVRRNVILGGNSQRNDAVTGDQVRVVSVG